MSSLEQRRDSPRRPVQRSWFNWPLLGGIALSAGLWAVVGWLAWRIFG